MATGLRHYRRTISSDGGGGGGQPLRRIGVPNDQYGNPAREAPPVYGGKLTPAHDWSEFEDAFARRAPISKLSDRPAAAVIPTLAPAPPRLLARPADQVEPAPQDAFQPSGARQAATELTGVDPATVSPAQRTANLRAAVGQVPAPVTTNGVTPIAPQYQAPGGPAQGTVRALPADAPMYVNGQEITPENKPSAYDRPAVVAARQQRFEDQTRYVPPPTPIDVPSAVGVPSATPAPLPAPAPALPVVTNREPLPAKTPAPVVQSATDKDAFAQNFIDDDEDKRRRRLPAAISAD